MVRQVVQKLMVSGASCVLAVAVGSPAFAQDASPSPTASAAPAPEDAPSIIVTGIRGSLQRNLDIKRAAPGVVDAISAEDIGKFPDPNVAASLQRLPACRCRSRATAARRPA
jgi:hypothetical protein